MMRGRSLVVPIAILLAAAAVALPTGAAAAQGTPVRTLDIGGVPGDTTARACLSDSMLTAALAAFNSPTTMHAFDGGGIPASVTIGGGYSMYQGQLLLAGTVQGAVVVLNGDVRVTATGRVTGTITVLGGRLFLDPGATVGGTFNCETQPALTRLPSGAIARQAPGKSIGSFGSGIALTSGDYRFTPHIAIGQYNRVEALPIHLGVNVDRTLGPSDKLRGELFGIGRTGSDPNGSRPALGWHASVSYSHAGSLPITVAVEGGSTIDGTTDQPYTPVESGVSAFLFRSDYTDWFLRRGASITASARPTRELTLTGAIDVSHQTTVLATDAFSVFSSTDAWRPNPLIDDGTYRTVTGRMEWDARDPLEHPVFSWFVRAELRHVSSNDLTPVSLPTTIRDALPSSGYGETEGDLDIRIALRIDPEQRIGFRMLGGGYMSGDPLTIQRRRAIGGADPLIGYDFRGINCDRRRRPDLATPALCDRSAAMQAEYHRTLPIDLSTRINGYAIGIRKPDLVLLADAGSAWLAGDSAGRVPANRIQSLREWKSDVGVGVTSGPFGLYLAKALTDPIAVQLTLLFSHRF
jgi:hypothetical protein